ncbi:MAG TPA: transglycosylase SLT domain-containing protein [Kofleriaceae bacterium]
MSLSNWHGHGGVNWRLQDGGVEIEDTGIERTRGAPSTVTRVWEQFAPAINEAAREHRMPCELIVATICTESAGNPKALRIEPGYESDEKTPHKVSPGLMQTLISTAREALQMSFDRDFLYEPRNSIRAGAAYMAQQKRKTGFDPPLVAAAYNAGGIYTQNGAKNRWKLRQFPIGTGEHCDRFVKFYNDAVAVLAKHATRPAMSHADFLADEQVFG